MTLQIGDKVPPFSATDVKHGVQISLDDYLDRPVVVVFSGLTWCPACQFEAPILQELWELYSWGVQFIILSVDDKDKPTLLAAVQQFGLTMPVIQDDSSIATEWIAKKTPDGSTHFSYPSLFVVQPSWSPPSQPTIGAPGGPPSAPADHHVVCDLKVGAPGPEAELKADLSSRIHACLSPSASGSDRSDWKDYNPIPWIDPGPLRRLTPRQRDILIGLGMGELARSLSDPGTGRALEQLAADAVLHAAQALRDAAHAKTVPARDMEAVETQLVEEAGHVEGG